jgi:hypothetical protein
LCGAADASDIESRALGVDIEGLREAFIIHFVIESDEHFAKVCVRVADHALVHGEGKLLAAPREVKAEIPRERVTNQKGVPLLFREPKIV